MAQAKKKTKRSRSSLSIESNPGAYKAALPRQLSPQLATLSADVPARGDWLYEIKFDGYRLLARFENGKPALITRRGNDWSSKMPGLIRELATLGIESAWLDGEIVVLGEHGAPDFNALQNAFDANNSRGIVYFLFDVPFFDGYDLRNAPLRERRQLLEAILSDKATEHVRFSEAFEGNPATILASACKMKLEGIIAKRANAPYQTRRTEDWLKLKCRHRQEFVVGGYVDRAGASGQVGSLLLGFYEAGELMFAGSVGTGWNSDEAAALKMKLAKLERNTSPFAGEPPKQGRWSKRKPGAERWVEPRLVAEVEFSEWTPDGHIRHAAYVGLRTDKPAKQIVREIAIASPGINPRR